MRTAALLLTMCASAVVILALPDRASAQEGGAGIVEEVRGTAYWRQNAYARADKLDPKLDAGRRIYPGEQVRCARGSSLSLLLGRRRKIIRQASWFTIPRSRSSQSNPIRRMLDEYGRPGGVERGDQLKVFAPSDHSVAVPEQVVFRWTPSAAGCLLSLTIRDVGGGRVWRREDVDGASGYLNDAAAKQALINYRAKTGRGPLTLQVKDTCGSDVQVSFLLLSVRSERSLKGELAFWGEGVGTLVKHLGRASVFSRYGVFPQAAEEYEAALRMAPDSRHLLIRTIIAHRQTGNFLRANQLEKQLPDKTSVP